MKTLLSGILFVIFGGIATGQPSIKAVVTTGMVGDLVRQIGGDRVEVTQLMGPGVDPHLYKPTPEDAASLRNADIIFFNGLMLEGRMEDLFKRITRSGKTTYAVSEGIPKERLLAAEDPGYPADPHIWMDVSLWALTVQGVADALSRQDPPGEETYQSKARDLKNQLNQLHEWCLEKANNVPEVNRILVTSHDAFNYFGNAYGFKVVGLQGVSTISEASLADVTDMVDLIREKNVPSIFVESSVNPAAIKRVAKDADIQIGGELFSDAMGAPGQMMKNEDVGTYEGMMRYNMKTISEGLGAP
jgi:manganese/zinc/iron transport system substrate-binding protein